MSIELGPDLVHPEVASAVGSRNSANRGDRVEHKESALVVDEGVDKVLNHISSKLPPEVLSKVDIMSNIKEKLHNYYNMSYQNMLGRYITTVEDELAKKYRDFISLEENKGLHKYTPRLISDILESIGGVSKFNTGEIEKSVVNIYGHLQGAIQRATYSLEVETNSILRQKTDVGAFIRGENTYAVAKCSIKDNKQKPKTVSDLKLAINILDSELISSILHLHQNIPTVLQTIASEEIMTYIDKEIDKINGKLLDEGKPELEENENIIQKIRLLENYVGDDKEEKDSARYQLIGKHILDSVDKMSINSADMDKISLRENVQRILENEGLRNRGHNTAVNMLTSVLDTSKMGFQHLENQKNSRVCRISEYTDNDVDQLPDERYSISLCYYDTDQILAMRESYEKQFKEFRKQFEEALWVVEAKYLEYKKEKKIIDYTDVLADVQVSAEIITEEEQGSFLSKFIGNQEDIGDYEELQEEELAREEEKEKEEEEKEKAKEESKDGDSTIVDESVDNIWKEFAFIKPKEKALVKQYKKFDVETRELREKYTHIKSRVARIYSRYFPEDRILIEERMSKLVDDFNLFIAKVNPFQIQPGICLEIDITSVKRKRSTILSMANVLNEFLYSVSKGFSDSAFASFQRRRSTIRDDIDQNFVNFDLDDDDDDSLL